MRAFDLISINWDKVRMMQAGQFKQETRYHEELLRWTLHHAQIFGLLGLSPYGISQATPQGEQLFAVTVRGCFGVGPEGYLIDIPDDGATAVQGTLDAERAVVPMFIGVAKTERDSETELRPSVDLGLVGSGGQRRKYQVASSSASSEYDWLQIAQFRKTANGLLEMDRNWFPECMFMSSHAGLWQTQSDLQGLANRALLALQENSSLQRNSSEAVQVYSAAMALAGSLGPAARMIDTRLYPHAYLDRLAQVFAAQKSQLLMLPDPGLMVYKDAIDKLTDTLDYLNGDWHMGHALLLARECFERLIGLYPPLLRKLGEAHPSSLPFKPEHETAFPAQEENRSEAPPPRKRGIIFG